jgi:hypothetical protein
MQDDIVTYTTKDGAAHEFDALEFLAALSSHVPKTYESITRYYGRYSSRRRGEHAKLAPLTKETVCCATLEPHGARREIFDDEAGLQEVALLFSLHG